jgi:methylmalonyl-CoA carboxyltransferase large subunit
MPTVTENDLAATLEQLQAQIAEISRRIQMLEKGTAGAGSVAAVPVQPIPAPAPAPAAITEEELLAISAAVGAYLGVRAHIRQIRLVSTSAWAQQGRVSIQASHRLQG